ncbi:MAG: hypothetical protein ACUVQI_10800 [Thermochromatium sp.]
MYLLSVNDLGVYLGLFASTFGAASLPLQSEVLLVALAKRGRHLALAALTPGRCPDRWPLSAV